MAFYILPLLMILLVAGTIAQRWMGLWPAYDMFFASFIIWAGPVPLPGGYILLGILAINLSAKFLLKSEWRWRKAGINLSHLGALVLLIGGLITAISAKEYFMLIAEGQETPYIYSYQEKALVVYKEEKLAAELNARNFNTQAVTGVPFEIKIIDHCANCEIEKREDVPASISTHGMAKFMALSPKAPGKNPEADLSGLTFEIRGAGEEQDGLYIAFDGMPQPIKIQINEIPYTILFGKIQERLPFSIKLEEFTKDAYQGSDMARDYISELLVIDGDSQWPVRIEMNEPLRYKGYTFFQSSFEETPMYDLSILAVVKNKGWLFPYIGALIIGAGLLLHLFIVIFERRHA